MPVTHLPASATAANSLSVADPRDLPSRARRKRQVRRVRQRLRRARRRARGQPAAAQALARELRQQRLSLATMFSDVGACASCELDVPERGAISGRHGPRPRADSPWRGGRCCCASAEQLFEDRELLLLAAGGTRPRDIVAPPRSTPVVDGCAFRGLSGCSLAPDHRPSVCAGYLCDALASALAADGRLVSTARQIAQMERQRQTFFDLTLTVG